MARHMDTMYASTTLVVEECFKCHILFGIPEDLRGCCLRDHTLSFYCPNGHGQVFTGPTREQQLEQRLASTEESVRAARADAELERRSAAAHKGHATRLKNRVAKGKCPCCSRDFPDLHAHMSEAHPGYGDEAGD